MLNVYNPRSNFIADVSKYEHYVVTYDLGTISWSNKNDIFLCDDCKIDALYFGDDEHGYMRALGFHLKNLSMSRPIYLSTTDMCKMSEDNQITTNCYILDKMFDTKTQWENDNCEDIDFSYISKEIRLMEIAHGISVEQLIKMRKQNQL